MAGNPFAIDWNDKEAVISYAKQLAKEGPPQVVIKYPERRNYNITFASRLHEKPERVEIVFRT